MEILPGLLFVFAAGLGTGTVAWPLKTKWRLYFDQFLLIFLFSAIILIPWSVMLLFLPHPVSVVNAVGAKPLIISNLLSAGWGIANILYMISVVRIGAALSGAILSSIGMATGSILPLLFKGSGLFQSSPGLFSTTGVFVVVGIGVVITGLIMVIYAGFGREHLLKQRNESKQEQTGHFFKDLCLVVLAGVLSCGLSLAFVYSQGPVIEAARSQGADEITANYTVWALGALGGGLISIGYSIFIISRNRMWSGFFMRRKETFAGIIAGIQFSISITLMGKGMLLLGAIGASIGFGIQQSMQIVGNQLIGFLSGEWRGIYGGPRRNLMIGLGIIFFAVLIFSYSNTLSG